MHTSARRWPQNSRRLSLLLLTVVWVHAPNGWLHVANGGGWEYPVFLTVMSVVLWLSGDGALALRRSVRFAPRAE